MSIIAMVCRHCEERSDAAIQWASEAALDCFAALAMTESPGEADWIVIPDLIRHP